MYNKLQYIWVLVTIKKKVFTMSATKVTKYSSDRSEPNNKALLSQNNL
jgi:hypothetical protein